MQNYTRKPALSIINIKNIHNFYANCKPYNSFTIRHLQAFDFNILYIRRSVILTLLLMFALFYSFPIAAQNKNNKTHFISNRDWWINSTAAASSAAIFTCNLLAKNKYANPRRWEFSVIDKYSKSKLNTKIAKISDWALITESIGISLAIAENNKISNIKNFNLLAQNLLFNYSVTQICKMSFIRARPYTRDQSFVFKKNDDVYSFFSGHASFASTLFFSGLMLNSEKNKWQNALLISGGALSLAVPILRVQAGKHFPSDVLVGYAIGFGISYLNIKVLHKI